MDIKTRRDIRKCYALYKNSLEKGLPFSPYAIGIDWMNIFSPIEDNVWGHIRYLGLPLYPQYPVGPYFIDFADPHRKIGIEVDSVKWHQNKEKDIKRENEIKKMGWDIYRIPSYMTFKCLDDYVDEEGRLSKENSKKYFNGCSEGILMQIYQDYLSHRHANVKILTREEVKGDY